MNIVHVITTIDRGGAEQQLLTLVREQLSMNKSVTVFVLKGSMSLLEEFKTLGAVVENLSSESFGLRQILLLRRTLKPLSPDVVHAHLPRAEVLTRLALIKTSYPFIVSRHNIERFLPSNILNISSILSRFITRRSRFVIAISNAVVSFLSSQNEVSKRSNLKCVYYGYQKNLGESIVAKSNVQLNSESHNVLIGTIARLVPQKDLFTLLSAFKFVVGEFANSKLIIVGDGWQKEELVHYAKSLGINEQTVFIPSTKTRLEILYSLDVFVLTSKYEGFGLVLLEAMQAKIPIVASQNTAIIEVMGKEYIGLFTTGSSKECAEKILYWLKASPEYKEKLQQYYTSNLSRFSPSKMAANIQELYITAQGSGKTL
jgi:glycosyltransferase involved in cell wall biosynthesis